MLTEKKKVNPHIKNAVVPVRFDNTDMQELITKAQLYTNGNLSLFIRLAVKHFKPLKKGKDEIK